VEVRIEAEREEEVEVEVEVEVEEEVEAPGVTAESLEKAAEVINRCFKAALPDSDEPWILVDSITRNQILADEVDEMTLEWMRSKGVIARAFRDLLMRGVARARFEFLKKMGAENIDMEKFLVTRLKMIWLERGQPDRAPPLSSHEEARRELRTMYPEDIFGQHDMKSEEDYFEATSGAVVTNNEKVVQGEAPYGNKYHVATRRDASGQEVEVSFGESGFAVVYIGYEADENDPVAIKTVYDTEEKIILLREAAMLERLEAEGMEGIVEKRDVGVFVPLDEDGYPEEDADGNEVTSYYMATTWAGDSVEYILRTMAEQGKTFSAYEAKQFAIGFLKILSQLHAKGILHLDIKPDNIFLRPIGTTAAGEPIYDFSNPVLGDFGTALEVRDTASLRRMYERYGTYLYMPPESTSFEYYSARSDMYALGWTLYAAFMGAFPEHDDEYYYLNNPPQISPEAERSIPANFLAFIRRLVDPEWNSRLPSAEEALKMAEAIPVARPPAPPLHFEALKLMDEKDERKDVDPAKEKADRKDIRKPVPGVNIKNVRGEDVFEMAPEELEAIRKALDLKTDAEVGALIREAFSALDAWGIDARRIKDKKILIALLKKLASKHLFEDHREDDFMGINEDFLNIGDPKIRRILFIVGLAHELRHEAGIIGERLDLDAMLTAGLLIREDVDVGAFRTVLSRYIESTEYIDEVERQPLIYLKGAYAQAESLFPVMRELMKRGARTRIIGPVAREDMAEAESDVRDVRRALGADGDNLDVKYFAFDKAKHEEGYDALTKEKGPLHNMLMRHNDDVAIMDKNPLLKPRMLVRLPRVRDRNYRERLEGFIRRKLEEINTDKRTGAVDRDTMDRSLKRVEIIDIDAASATAINPVVDVIVDAGMMEVDRYENKEAKEYAAEAPRRLKENLAMLLNSSLEGIMTTDEKVWDKKITADNLYNVMTQMFAGKLFWVIRAIDWASERQKFDAKQAVLRSL
jgi:serine/threonine protein kinase